MTEWKIRQGDEEKPAAGVETLRAWAQSGVLRPDDYVFNPVLNQWLYAKDLAELQAVYGELGRKCPRCGEFAVKKVDGLRGIENLWGLFLVAFLFLPAVVYYFDRTRHPYCTSCKHRIPHG